jgi:DNA modification methylase
LVWADGWKGQLGQEQTPELFISHLCDIFDEVKQVLKPEGVLFVNIDDSYGDNKSLMGIPEMFLLQMINRGWILRNKIVYAKSNPMPESVKDRFTCDWEPVFFFTKREKYYFEQQLEPMLESSLQRAQYHNYSVKADTGVYAGMDLAEQANYFDKVRSGNNLRNKRCVWPIPTTSPGIEMCQSCQRIYNGAEFDNLPKKVTHHKPSGKRPSDKIDQALEGRGQDLLRPICHCGSSDFISHYACVDSETECLTYQGWKSYKDLVVGEKVASYNLATGKLEWVPLKEVFSYKVNEQEMVAIKGRNLDCLLTPNHRCIVRKKGVFVVEADELDAHYLIPTAAPMEKGSSFMSPDWAELCGWFLSEGWINNQGNTCIGQSPSANPKKVSHIRELLIACKCSFKEYLSKRQWKGREANFVTFTLDNKASAHLLNLCSDKTIPSLVLSWSKEARRRFLEGFIGGDGHIRKDGRVIITQKNKVVLDWLQAVALSLGYGTMLTTKRGGIWVLYLSSHQWRNCHNSKGPLISRKYFTGVVWCPRTKYTTWVARRNGKPFITGNSFPIDLCITPILAGSPEGGTVLDPFAGSGTIGVAARRLGRKAILIDVSEPYVKMAAYRIRMEPLPLFGTTDEDKPQLVSQKQLSLFEIPR